MFQGLLDRIYGLVSIDFEVATSEIANYIDDCDNIIEILKQIGTIPEEIEADSTQEKLFSKASDAALARAFRELGLKSIVLKERADSADVLAESYYHGYTLVADAKAFRLSRTAKNQKDFKISALSSWRKEAEYAVLCAPYFQYPVIRSQIYAQAVENNVCLITWEHIIFLLENNIRESELVNLSSVWNISDEYALQCTIANRKKCFMPVINKEVFGLCGKSEDDFDVFLRYCHKVLSARADEEMNFWHDEILKISSYTREEAIIELIKAKKIEEKILQIEKYIAGIKV